MARVGIGEPCATSRRSERSWSAVRGPTARAGHSGGRCRRRGRGQRGRRGGPRPAASDPKRPTMHSIRTSMTIAFQTSAGSGGGACRRVVRSLQEPRWFRNPHKAIIVKTPLTMRRRFRASASWRREARDRAKKPANMTRTPLIANKPRISDCPASAGSRNRASQGLSQFHDVGAANGLSYSSPALRS